MQYVALYRKYRPDNFDDIVGQNYVIKTLKNEIINNKLSHAYLFYGPRGTGKTTMAKTISKLINCENLKGYNTCEKCNSCVAFNNKNNPDIIEIDAASNNGVDEIRIIRDNVNLMPSISKYKVYIIDEVHMLSNGAFNALLKTLEEPPKHVIFILATTEFYKVPETIVSRCQTFEFERISVLNIKNKLRFISDQENIKVSDETLDLIAKYSNGGLRDSINMLDKLSACSNNITCEDFYDLKGISKEDDILLLTKYLFAGSAKDVFKQLDFMTSNGKNLSILTDNLIDYFKKIIIGTIDHDSSVDFNNYYDIIDILLKIQLNIKQVDNPLIIVEVGLLKIFKLLNKNDRIISREIILEEKCIKNTKKKIKKDINVNLNQFDTEKIDNNDKICIDNEINIVRINNAFATANKKKLKDLKIRWVDFSDYLYDDKYINVVSYLIDGDLRVVGDSNVIISVKYDSILQNAHKNIVLITELFNLVANGSYNLCFVSDAEWNELKIEYISNIKAGIVYKLLDENIIVNKSNIEEQSVKNYSKVVNNAISLFGNDIIEIK